MVLGIRLGHNISTTAGPVVEHMLAHAILLGLDQIFTIYIEKYGHYSRKHDQV